MVALGTKAPEFYLKNMESGTESFSFADLKGKRNVNPIHLQSLSLCAT
jgi:peroxiredoxin